MRRPARVADNLIMSRSRQDSGFTLVELLVVVAIIAILAAIALPAFLGQTRGASDSKAKTDASTAYMAMEAFWAERDTYDAGPAELVARESALSGARNLTVSGTADTFRISTDSERGSTFVIEKDAFGTVRHRCTPAGVGGCDDDGVW